MSSIIVHKSDDIVDLTYQHIFLLRMIRRVRGEAFGAIQDSVTTGPLAPRLAESTVRKFGGSVFVQFYLEQNTKES